mmetsp:Transcript_29317/g.40674  ORF Transcript_29317/g.40674 Transcript_29317/m.40674 type:complete len:138 (+) Transcript_29317:281-694(+)
MMRKIQVLVVYVQFLPLEGSLLLLDKIIQLKYGTFTPLRSLLVTTRSSSSSSSCSSSSSSSNGAPSTPSPGNERGVYDLYAVSNHSGSLGFGHYTAYAKTEGGQWYNFDDSIVSKMPKGAPVQSKASYLLFYKKRGE